MENNDIEKGSEPRKILDQYHSVEFSTGNLDPVYQFKIRGISLSGMGVLVKEDSAVLKRLEVGDVLDMRDNPMKSSDPSEYLRTEIRRITKLGYGRYKGHYLIGSLILRRSKD